MAALANVRATLFAARVCAVLYLCLYGHVDGFRHRVETQRPLRQLKQLGNLKDSVEKLQSAFETFDVEDNEEVTLGKGVHVTEGPPLGTTALLELEEGAGEETGKRGAEIFLQLQTFRDYVYNNVLSKDKFPEYSRPEGEESGVVNTVKHYFGEKLYAQVKSALFKKGGYIQTQVESGLDFMVEHAVRVTEAPREDKCSSGRPVDLRGFAAIPKLDVRVKDGTAQSVLFQQEEIVVEEVGHGREHVSGTKDDRPVDGGDECSCLRFPVKPPSTPSTDSKVEDSSSADGAERDSDAQPEPSMLSRFFRSAYKPNSMALVKDCAVSDDYSTFDPKMGTGMCRTTHMGDPTGAPGGPFHVTVWARLEDGSSCPEAQRMPAEWATEALISKEVITHACRLATVRYSGLVVLGGEPGLGAFSGSGEMSCANSGSAETMETIKDDDYLKAFKVSMPQTGVTGRLVNWVWGAGYVQSMNDQVKSYVKSANLISDESKDAIPERCFDSSGEWTGRDTDDAMLWVTHEKKGIKCYSEWQNSKDRGTDAFIEEEESTTPGAAAFTGSDGPLYSAARMTRDKLKVVLPTLLAPLMRGATDGPDADQALSHAALITRSPLEGPGGRRRHSGAVSAVEDALSSHIARAMLTGRHGLEAGLERITSDLAVAHRSRAAKDGEAARPHTGTDHEALVDAFLSLAEESHAHARSLVTTRSISTILQRIWRAIVSFLKNYYDIIIAVAAFVGFAYGATWLSHTYVQTMNDEIINKVRDVNVFRGEEGVGTFAKRKVFGWIGWDAPSAAKTALVKGLDPLQAQSFMSMVPTSAGGALGGLQNLWGLAQSVASGSLYGNQVSMASTLTSQIGAEQNLWWFQKMGESGTKDLLSMPGKLREYSLWYNKLSLVFSVGMIVSGAYIIYWLVQRVIWAIRQIYLWMTRQVEDDVCTPTLDRGLFNRAAHDSVLARKLHAGSSWMVDNVLGTWSYRYFNLPSAVAAEEDDDATVDPNGTQKCETKDDLSGGAVVLMCTFDDGTYHCYDKEEFVGTGSQSYPANPPAAPNQITKVESCGTKCVEVTYVNRGRPDPYQETWSRAEYTMPPTQLLVMSRDAWDEYVKENQAYRMPVKCYSDSHGNKEEEGKCRWPIIPLTPNANRLTETFTEINHADGTPFEYPLPSTTAPDVPSLKEGQTRVEPGPPSREAKTPGHIKKDIPFFCAGQDVEFVFRPFFYWYRTAAGRMYYPNTMYVIDPELADFNGTPGLQPHAKDVGEMLANAYVRHEFPDAISKVRETEHIWNVKNKLMDVALSGNANDRTKAIYTQWAHRITCGKYDSDGNFETMKLDQRDTGSTEVLCRIIIPYGDLLGGYKAVSEEKCTTGGMDEKELEQIEKGDESDPDLKGLNVGGEGGKDFERCGAEYQHMPLDGRLIYISLGYTSVTDISFGALLPVRIGVSAKEQPACKAYQDIAIEYDELADAADIGSDMCEAPPAADTTFPSFTMPERSDLCWGMVKDIVFREDSDSAPNFYKECARPLAHMDGKGCADNMMNRLRGEEDGTPWTDMCSRLSELVKSKGDVGGLERDEVRPGLMDAVKAEGLAKGSHCHEEYTAYRAKLKEENSQPAAADDDEN